MKACRVLVSLVLLFGSLALSGCGKERVLNVAIKVAEEEAGRDSVQLVESLVLNYRDGSGAQQFSQKFPVPTLSTSQPFRPAVDSSIPWDRDGVFEASAYDSEGQVLLTGRAQADPEKTDTVEIVMRRPLEAHAASLQGSPMLKKVQLRGSDGKVLYEVSAAELRSQSARGGCVEPPVVTIPGREIPSSAIIVETGVKAATVYHQIGAFDRAGSFATLAELKPMAIQSSGFPGVELDGRLLDGKLLTSPNALSVMIFSAGQSGQADVYEGRICLKTEPLYQVAEVKVTEVKKAFPPLHRMPYTRLSNIVQLTVTNSNAYPVACTIRLLSDMLFWATWEEEDQVDSNSTKINQGTQTVVRNVQLPAGQTFTIFAYSTNFPFPGTDQNLDIRPFEFRLNYSIEAKASWWEANQPAQLVKSGSISTQGYHVPPLK